MKRVLRLLGIPFLSYETTYDESDFYGVVSNTGGEFELAATSSEGEDEEEYYSPDDPEGFGFRSLE